MTKGNAEKLARKQLRLGHFTPSGARSEANCPLCSERVGVDHNPWEKREPHLRNALTEHLVWDCKIAA